MTATLQAGFADPVHDSQGCFRDLLDAMAHPGRIARIGGVAPPAPLDIATAAAMLTLVDHETKLWLDPAASAARDWIGFHCGPAMIQDPAICAFALALSPPDLASFCLGTHEEPETATTVVCQVLGFDSGPEFRLSGPGLREPVELRIDGLGKNFAAAWRANRALFPRGIDLILCAGDRLTALPRSVSIQEL